MQRGMFHEKGLRFPVSDHTAAGGHCASQRRWDAAVTRAQSTDCTKTRCGEDAWFCENVESWTVCLTSGGNRALMAASIDNHEIR